MAIGSGSTLGRKLRGVLAVPGIDVEIPYTDARGLADGPTVLVTGGVHGGEYPGIAAAVETARRLDPAVLRGRVLVVHLTNPPAFWGKTQYWNPLDGRNLNRCFPGDPEGSASERMAAAVFGLAREADYWIDLHGGDIHEALVPFSNCVDSGLGSAGEVSRRMAEAYGIPRVITSDGSGACTYEAAVRAGIPAILTEAGQVGQLDPACVRMHVDGVENVLRLVGVLPGAPAPHPDLVVYENFDWVRAASAGLWQRRVEPGQTVRAGEVGGTLTDVYGDLVEEVRVPADGELIFIATSLAIGRDDPLLAVAH